MTTAANGHGGYDDRGVWPNMVFFPVLVERQAIGGIVAWVRVYRHEHGMTFCDRTAKHPDGTDFLKSEVLVARDMTRAIAVHRASEWAKEWWSRVREAQNRHPPAPSASAPTAAMVRPTPGAATSQ